LSHETVNIAIYWLLMT